MWLLFLLDDVGAGEHAGRLGVHGGLPGGDTVLVFLM